MGCICGLCSPAVFPSLVEQLHKIGSCAGRRKLMNELSLQWHRWRVTARRSGCASTVESRIRCPYLSLCVTNSRRWGVRPRAVGASVVHVDSITPSPFHPLSLSWPTQWRRWRGMGRRSGCASSGRWWCATCSRAAPAPSIARPTRKSSAPPSTNSTVNQLYLPNPRSRLPPAVPNASTPRATRTTVGTASTSSTEQKVWTYPAVRSQAIHGGEIR